MLVRTLLICLIAAGLSPVSAQHRSCATMARHRQLAAANPALVARRQQIEAHTQAAAALGQATDGILRIPVVVHVVYASPAQNLSDAQIQSQMTVLNEDFRRTNPDVGNTPAQFVPVAADSQIEFCLATVDPQGNPTTGITRTATAVSSFPPDDSVKSTAQGGKDGWPAGDYLNIWVCNISQGILGYAQFPGGPAPTDGIVCLYSAFGRGGSAQPPFDKGRTCTHEVGHYLNLFHIWGDGGCGVDDAVADTPMSDAPNYGCPQSHTSCGSLDMVQNYMDYTDDGCMNLFTQGQRTRMRALFAPGGARASLLNSNACGPVGPPPSPQYQVNQPRSALTVDGLVGTAQSPATKSACTNATVTMAFSSTLVGSPWDVALGSRPLLSATGGAFQTAGGQIVNVDLTDPAIFFMNSGNIALNLLPFPGNYTSQMPTGTNPATLTSQQVLLTATHPDGLVLSQANQVDVGAGSVNLPAGPTGDDDNVTVALTAGGCGVPVAFYGTTYTEFHVSSNGRVVFGAPDTSFSATVADARSGNPFVGFWTDLDPTSGGTINLTSPGPARVRVAYDGAPYWGEVAAPTFAIEFDAQAQTVSLDGLAGIVANPQVFGGFSGTNQFLGMSPGNNAQDPGTTTFAPSGSGAGSGTGMLYDYYDWTANSSGLVSSLQGSLDRITFVPSGSNYSWNGF